MEMLFTVTFEIQWVNLSSSLQYFAYIVFGDAYIIVITYYSSDDIGYNFIYIMHDLGVFGHLYQRACGRPGMNPFFNGLMHWFDGSSHWEIPVSNQASNTFLLTITSLFGGNQKSIKRGNCQCLKLTPYSTTISYSDKNKSINKRIKLATG